MADDMRDLWCTQPVEPIRMSAEEVRRKARAFESKVRLWFRMAIALLVFLAIGYASFLYFFPGTVQRVGAALALAGFIFGAYQLYRRGPARKVSDGPAMSTVAAYRAELERQRDFHSGAWLRLVAFVPGPVVFIAGFVAGEQALVVAAALAAAPFAVGIPLGRREAQKLQAEIDRLEGLMG
jgi:hypothetical protein